MQFSSFQFNNKKKNWIKSKSTSIVVLLNNFRGKKNKINFHLKIKKYFQTIAKFSSITKNNGSTAVT